MLELPKIESFAAKLSLTFELKQYKPIIVDCLNHDHPSKPEPLAWFVQQKDQRLHVEHTSEADSSLRPPLPKPSESRAAGHSTKMLHQGLASR